MAKKQDYIPLEKYYEEILATFEPDIAPCDYMSHGDKYTVITPRAGNITFMLDRDDLENKRGEPATVSIFAKFENEKAARALGFDCNMFNGKWNHHFLYSKAGIRDVFEQLRKGAF